MISLRQDALLLSLKPAGSIQLMPDAEDRRAWASVEASHKNEIILEAEKALKNDVPPVSASGCGTQARRDAVVMRREMLKRLVMGICVAGNDRYVRAAGELIYAICEESDWSNAPGVGGFADYTHRTIDVDACETGALLSLSVATCAAFFGQLSPLIASRVQWEVERRLIEPMVAEEGQLLTASHADVPRAVAALFTAVLMVEDNERRRWQSIRRIVRILENHMNAAPESQMFAMGLEAYLRRAIAIGDCFAMIGAASGGEVELRDERMFVEMARTFVDAYIEDGHFFDPGGRSMKPNLSCDQLFRLGESARYTPLCALASYLRRHERPASGSLVSETESLLGQMAAAFSRGDLMREPMREPRPEAIESRSVGLLAARMEGFYCAMNGAMNAPGTARLNVGDMALFYGGKPIIMLGGETEYNNVPIVNGAGQLSGGAARDVALREGPGYRMLSMDIAEAYDRGARLVCWQRTLMLAPFEGGVRLMEVFDFDGTPGRATFRFLTPHKPEIGPAGVRMGPVVMSYDARLTCDISVFELSGETRAMFGPSANLMTFSMQGDAPGGNFAFVFRSLGKH